MRVLEDLLSSGTTDVPLGMYDRVLSQLVENQLVDQAIDTYRTVRTAHLSMHLAHLLSAWRSSRTRRGCIRSR